MLDGGLQRQFITVCPKTKQAASRDIAKVAVVPKLLPGKRVAEMNFNKRDLYRQQRIAQGDAGVRETTGVQNDKIDAVGRGLLHPVDQFVFGIALEGVERMPVIGRDFATAILDVRKARGAVNIGFACAQEVQVGAVNQKER